MTPPFPLSKTSQGIVPTVMSNVLKWTVQKDIISFAGGMPDPKFFPLNDITEAAKKVAKESGSIIFQYSPAKGHDGLKSFFQEHFRKKGIDAEKEDILPVNGVQQGIHLCSELFLDPGDKILITAPSYFGALQTFDAFLVDYLTIPLNEDGLDLVQLEFIFKNYKPKFFYIIPSFQNPSGISIPEKQRPKIVELAKKYQVPIIEDDVFGDLYFEKALPPLRSYDKENVIYLTSISKSVSAGFRLGFLVSPPQLSQKLLLTKQLNDVSLNTYVQYLTYELCQNGSFDKLLKKLRKKYEERKNALLAALEKYYSDYATWTKPSGGMFLWLYLKKDINADQLLEYCAERGLVFLPGSAFFPAGQNGKSELRLSFSNLPPKKVEKGIRLLAEYTREYLKPARP